MNGQYVLALIPILIVAALLFSLAILRWGRSNAIRGGPRCGHCEYDLTGSASNRCPECGLLFIEAGIRFEAREKSRSTLLISAIAMLGVVAVLAGISFTIRSFQVARASQQRAAVAAQQAAAARQAAVSAALKKSSETTTRPRLANEP